MATILSTTLLNLFLISSFFLILLLSPACKAEGNILYSGKNLSTNTYLEYGSYQFTMQEDCNLVLYDKGIAYWHSNTAGKGYRYCHCTLETDGRLAIHAPPNSRIIWASNTARDQGSYVLILQSDRNVVIYGGAIWATGTNTTGSASAIPVVSWVSSEDTNHTAVVDGVSSGDTNRTTVVDGSGTIIDM